MWRGMLALSIFCPAGCQGLRVLGYVWLANCYFSKIPQDSPSCYHSSMRNLVVLFIHLIAVLARLLGPGGVRSVVAESLLLKHQLLIDIGETSVSKYMVRCRKPPSQTWRTFLDNHLQQLVSIDFFTVPTIRFQALYVFLVLGHDRRRILQCNVTAHPTAEWTGQQLREAFPFDQVPGYLLRDRDAIFGQDFRERVRDMGIHEVLSAPRSPWQRAYVERVIGSIRRECLDHVVVFNAKSLRRILASYFTYYHRSRTHLSLGKDSPLPRPIQPPEMGPVVVVPQVGGLHHRYEQVA